MKNEQEHYRVYINKTTHYCIIHMNIEHSWQKIYDQDHNIVKEQIHKCDCKIQIPWKAPCFPL